MFFSLQLIPAIIASTIKAELFQPKESIWQPNQVSARDPDLRQARRVVFETRVQPLLSKDEAGLDKEGEHQGMMITLIFLHI